MYICGYTELQIGGAKVSKVIRLVLGNKLRDIPLSNFTKKQTGEYINVVTTDVNNYEQILTHKIGDITKNLTLSIIIALFAGSLFLPEGCLFFAELLLLIPIIYLYIYLLKWLKNMGQKRIRYFLIM